VIDRQTVEVVTATEREAVRLLDRISDLNRRQFVPVIARVLAEFDRPGTTIRIDKLDVALGTIPPDRLELAVERLEHALREALTRSLEALERPPAGSTATHVVRSGAVAVAILDRYLRDGVWPYNGHGTASDPADLFATVLTAEPPAIAALLRRHRDRPHVLARMARQLPTEALEATLRMLAGYEASAILALLVNARNSLHETGAGLSGTTIMARLWEIALQQVLAEDVSSISRLIAFELSEESDIAPIQPGGARLASDRILARRQNLQEHSPESTTGDGAPRNDSTLLDDLAFPSAGAGDLLGVADHASAMLESFLRYGEHPSIPLDTLIMELAAENPDELVRLFSAHGRNDAVLRRLAEVIGEKALELLLTALDPQTASTIIIYMAETRRLHRIEPVVPLSDPAFARLLAYIALRHLLYEAGSHFNRRTFIVTLIEEIAFEEDLAFRDVLNALYRGVLETAKAEPLAGSLPAIIAELALDLERSNEASPVPDEANTSASLAVVFGSLERLATAADATPSAELTQALKEAHERDPVAFSRLVRRLAPRMGAILLQRLSRILTFPIVLRLVLQPSFAADLARLSAMLTSATADRNLTADAVESAVLTVTASQSSRSISRTEILGQVLRSIAALAGLKHEQLTQNLLRGRDIRARTDEIVTFYQRLDLLRDVICRGALPWRALMADPTMTPQQLVEALRRDRPLLGLAALSDAALMRIARDVEPVLGAMPREGGDEQLPDLIAALEAPRPASVPMLLAMVAAALKNKNADEAWRGALRQLLATEADAVRDFLAEGIESEPDRLALFAGPMLEELLTALVPRAAPTLTRLIRALTAHAADIGIDRQHIFLGALSQAARIDRNAAAGISLIVSILRSMVGDLLLPLAASILQHDRSVNELPGAVPAALAALASQGSEIRQNSEALRRDAEALQRNIQTGLHMRAVVRADARPEAAPFEHDTEWLFRALASGDLTGIGASSEVPRLIEALLDRLLKSPEPELAKRLLVFLRNAANRSKLTRLLPERLLARLVLQAAPRTGGRLLRAGELLAEAAALGGASVDRASFWHAIFETAVAPNGSDAIGALAERFFAAAGHGTDESDARRRESLGTVLLEAAAQLARDAGDAALLAAVQMQRAALLSAFADTRGAPAASSQRAPRERKSAARPLRRRTAFRLDRSDDDLKDEPIFIANAGLVLANPFLPVLFDRLGLMVTGENGKPRLADEHAASRAAHLLQYLVDGRVDRPEPLLVLNKILCGMPVAAPVERAIEPTDAERETCDGLLQAMVEHWPMIRGTSIAGLRETFLQREGKLVRREDTWQLEVQRRTVDILMENLPWSIGVVFHPWMASAVHVTW
jgi:hypothetical protein